MLLGMRERFFANLSYYYTLPYRASQKLAYHFWCQMDAISFPSLLGTYEMLCRIIFKRKLSGLSHPCSEGGWGLSMPF
jgi:hypothetical protein